MNLEIYKSNEEQIFLERTRNLLCNDLIGTIHDTFAGTYNMSSTRRIWNLFQMIKWIKKSVKIDGETSPYIIGTLADIIKYCLVWMYFLIDWEKVEQNEQTKTPVEH